MRAASRLLALGCACIPLVGCVSMSGLGGDSRYACKAPDGVTCDSVSGTYANALQNNLPGQRAKASTRGDGDAGKDAHAAPARVAPRTASALPAASSGDPGAAWEPSPLRSQTRLLRLWTKPWEDADGDLYDQGYVYVRVDNGRWLIEHVQRQIRDRYAPLRPPPASAAGSSSAPAEAGQATDLSPLQRPAAPGPSPMPSPAQPLSPQ
ncbi:type IV conjugative transfer system lipoprotein TraV [Cupriavidus basilensis]|uniref:Type IV conjugative transfer system lipoprotein TraV n=1 Tax=Cupriavidus basilensis TaxID=68895 RepID=A0ABT6ALZ1_9BURK|nr:type IV conjugative transfer system lipoprotein TraV [Cupriavidus basilensis]MDF3833454.1 type IV conjugative transfer system lipoprotein TraV [Cupriavidus basilensis]